jgi:hypothetical protein
MLGQAFCASGRIAQLGYQIKEWTVVGILLGKDGDPGCTEVQPRSKRATS